MLKNKPPTLSRAINFTQTFNYMKEKQILIMIV